LLELIRNEHVAIDVALWFIEDERYATELINRHNAGIPVRVLTDQRAVNSYGQFHPAIVARLRDAGIPLREKYTGNILHFKMMMFHGQNMLQFSKANYTPFSFVPAEPNVNYFDEAPYFTNDDRLTASFRRRFDDLWVNTTQYRNLANIAGALARRCPTCTIDPSMNFPPLEDFANRSVARYVREPHGIDAIVFRVTDHRHPDGMIGAVARGVPVRVITEPSEYRNPERPWHAKHVDRMWNFGVQIKHRQHAGLTHQASVVLRGLGEVIFGSSNWTTASASYQDEHNYFYNPGLQKPWFFQWFADQFDAKWNDTTNYVPFQPLPPDNPAYYSPSPGAIGQDATVTLTWDGGSWAHLYDIYFGTTPDPPLFIENVELGSPVQGQLERFTMNNLQLGTTYYWRIVGKTWAQRQNSGSVWSFTIAGQRGALPDGAAVSNFTCQGAGARETVLDFDGDGCADIGIWRSSTGMWGVLPSAARFAHASSQTLWWGSATHGDVLVPEDYDGDRRADVAVWRPATGHWAILGSRSNFNPASAVIQVWGSGAPAYQDVPVPADYDGDTRADVAVWRPGSGQWLIWRSSNQSLLAVQWGSGAHRDVPVPGDYDGDGRADPAVWRPATGMWYALLSSTAYLSHRAVQWGRGGDRPVARDYDGNGTVDVAVWRPSTGSWHVRAAQTFTINWGAAGDEPVPADYDGDGRADLAVFRPHTGVWHVLRSTQNYGSAFHVQWGAGLPPYGDQPLLRR
jgi:hypothetical protein